MALVWCLAAGLFAIMEMRSTEYWVVHRRRIDDGLWPKYESPVPIWVNSTAGVMGLYRFSYWYAFFVASQFGLHWFWEAAFWFAGGTLTLIVLRVYVPLLRDWPLSDLSSRSADSDPPES